jgi:hypothetical protein
MREEIRRMATSLLYIREGYKLSEHNRRHNLRHG